MPNEEHFFRSHIWNGRSHPNKDRHAHDLNCRTGLDGWRSRAWKTLGLDKRSERKRDHLDGLLSTKSYCLLQPESLTLCLQGWNSIPQESLWKHYRKGSQKAPGKLGETLRCLKGRRVEGLPSAKVGRNAPTPSMECIYFKVVLSVKKKK